MTIANIPHIAVDDKGIARIAGKHTRVIDIILDRRANSWGPEQIQHQHPQLSLAQIYAAFAYYYDHQAEIDKAIERELHDIDNFRAQTGPSPVAKRLRDAGKLP